MGLSTLWSCDLLLRGKTMKHTIILQWNDLKVRIEGHAKTEINTIKTDVLLIASTVIEKTQELEYGKPKITTRNRK